jgi:hypothetical protein
MLIAKLEVTFYHKERRTTRIIQFDLKAKDQYTTNGDWAASDKASKELSKIYFGDDAGVWSMDADEEGHRSITFMDQSDATGISVLWTDMAKAILFLLRVPILPLRVGHEGPGTQYASPGHPFYWKVVGA